jgi:hypothetical protein
MIRNGQSPALSGCDLADDAVGIFAPSTEVAVLTFPIQVLKLLWFVYVAASLTFLNCFREPLAAFYNKAI